MIDTLKYTRDLEKAGLAPEVAEMLVRGQMSMITDNVATKLDILELKAELKAEFKAEIKELGAEIKELGAKMNAQDSKFELQVQRMTNRLGVIVIGSMGALGALMTFLSAG